MENLTRYNRPGKFEGGLLIDVYAYDLVMRGGVDEEFDFGRDGFVDIYTANAGPFEVSPLDAEPLAPVDVEFLRTCAGYILYEDDQGFVSVKWFDTPRAFDREVDRLSDEMDAFLDGAEEDI